MFSFDSTQLFYTSLGLSGVNVIRYEVFVLYWHSTGVVAPKALLFLFISVITYNLTTCQWFETSVRYSTIQVYSTFCPRNSEARLLRKLLTLSVQMLRTAEQGCVNLTCKVHNCRLKGDEKR